MKYQHRALPTLAKKFPNVSRVDCIEASVKAVKELIPRNINFYNLEKRVKPVLGSFDNLEDETAEDKIARLGARPTSYSS